MFQLPAVSITTTLALLMTIGFSPNALAGGPDPQNIAISEVYYLGNVGEDWVELINRGSEPVNITGWRWCARFDYPSISVADILTGNADLTLDPGEIIVLDVGIDLNDTSSDLGLYTQSPFGTAANMVDFVQWGTDVDVGRSDVADDKGIWLELSKGSYDFVPTAATEQTLNWLCEESGGNFLTTSMDFVNTVASPGLPNVVACDIIFASNFD